MQGTQVGSLVLEDPKCCGATKSSCHNYWRQSTWSPCSTREDITMRRPCTAAKSSPCLPQLEKALTKQWRLNTTKKQIVLLKIYIFPHERLQLKNCPVFTSFRNLTFADAAIKCCNWKKKIYIKKRNIFKNTFLKLVVESRLFECQLSQIPCLTPYSKCCTLSHHSLMSVDSLYCVRASRPNFGSVTGLFISAFALPTWET